MSTRNAPPAHPGAAPRAGRRTARAGRSPRALLLTSAGSGVLGLLLLAGLLGDPLAGTDGPGDLLPPVLLGAALCGLALLGLATGSAAPPAVRRASAAAAVLGHLALASSTDLIMLFGYLLAAALPLGAALLAALACRRSRPARVLVVLLVAGVAVWGAVTGVLVPTNVAGTFGRVLPAMLAAAGEEGLLLWLAVGLLVAVRSLVAALGPGGRAVAEGWLLRHQRGLTLLAAAGPVPYVLVRATWLTPWPQGAGADLDPGIRLWGLLLGGAGLLGAVLTVGLVRPWGSALPSWVPVLGGRAVPVRAAVVPASAVAAALVLAAVPMATSTATALGGAAPLERVLFLVLFPFWLWGPALALATWAYAVRRRRDAGAAGAAGWAP